MITFLHIFNIIYVLNLLYDVKQTCIFMSKYAVATANFAFKPVVYR